MNRISVGLSWVISRCSSRPARGVTTRSGRLFGSSTLSRTGGATRRASRLSPPHGRWAGNSGRNLGQDHLSEMERRLAPLKLGGAHVLTVALDRFH